MTTKAIDFVKGAITDYVQWDRFSVGLPVTLVVSGMMMVGEIMSARQYADLLKDGLAKSQTDTPTPNAPLAAAIETIDTSAFDAEDGTYVYIKCSSILASTGATIAVGAAFRVRASAVDASTVGRLTVNTK